MCGRVRMVDGGADRKNGTFGIRMARKGLEKKRLLGVAVGSH